MPFLMLTASHGAAGQPKEFCVSRCVAGIEWASGTVVSSKLFCFVDSKLCFGYKLW